jgi:hypothetical protein
VIALAFHLIAQPDLASIFGDLLVRLLTLLVVITAATLVAISRYQLAGPATLVRARIRVRDSGRLLDCARRDVGAGGGRSAGPRTLRRRPVGAALRCARADRPRWTLIAGLTAATMWPLAYAINVARFDFTVAPWTRLVVWPGVNYVMVLLGWLLGRRFADVPVARARRIGGRTRKYHLLAPIGPADG